MRATSGRESLTSQTILLLSLDGLNASVLCASLRRGRDLFAHSEAIAADAESPIRHVRLCARQDAGQEDNMNTHRNSAGVRRATYVAAALLATVATANAGGRTHVMPADYGQTHPTYEFKVVSLPSAESPLTVQLVNVATGQPVANAHVTMRHTVWLGSKGSPQTQRVLVALQPDGRGDYICSRGGLLAGEKIVLRAHVPGESSATWVTVAAGN
jgi:hypothetical protein